MTKEALFKAVTGSELFKDIDQSVEFSTFIHERENQIGLDVMNNSEYKGLQKERERMEAEFISLYANQEIGKKKIFTYGDIVDRQDAISDMTHYQTGFTEGVKFIIGLLME
jgi:hypothetical protein